MSFDRYLPQFTSAQACEAAGITMVTLKNWISREPSVIHVPAKEWTDTNRLRFSFVRVMQIALTDELRSWGFELRKAADLAMKFSDLGETGGSWGGEPTKLTRAPGALYPKGSTILVADRLAQKARIVNIGDNRKVDTADLFYKQGVSVVLVDIDMVDRRVRDSLGL